MYRPHERSMMGFQMAQQAPIAVRKKQTVAELLASVPSYEHEADIVRARVTRNCPLPSVLIDIVNEYVTARWFDQLLNLWRMAPMNQSRYGELTQVASDSIRMSTARKSNDVRRREDIAKMVKMLGMSDLSINRVPNANNVGISTGLFVKAVTASNDPYSMDHAVLNSAHLLMLAIELEYQL
jgi:hypothetical protein